jgi:hypothetical protein
MGVASWDGGPDELDDGELAPTMSPADQPHADAERSWLFNGIHTFAIDPRRRLGGHGRAKRLLAGERGTVDAAPPAWHDLGSALQRHTLHSGLAQLSADERSVIKLAYLQGRTNHQIAAILGLSVSTVRRRLSLALEHLDDYARRTGTRVFSLALIGLAYIASRIARFGRMADVAGSSEWSHRLAATFVAGAVTTAALGLVVASPDSPSKSVHSRPPVTALALPAVSDPHSPGLPAPAGAPFQPVVAVRTVHLALSTTGAGEHVNGTSDVAGYIVAASHPSNHGCGGKPTNAPPQVPVGPRLDHATGAPVTHPTAGGCRSLSSK